MLRAADGIRNTGSLTFPNEAHVDGAPRNLLEASLLHRKPPGRSAWSQTGGYPTG